jgi:hypothetical protein
MVQLRIIGCLGKNVTDNVEALLDMVLANVPALRFQKVLHKC